jgi:hypothetical protein
MIRALRRPQFGNYTLVGVLFLQVIWQGIAWAACEPQTAASTFPSAAKAITDWELARSTSVALSARSQILTDFCEAANEVKNSRSLSSGAIDAVAGKVVRNYLDRVVDPKEVGLRFSAALHAEFGAQGLARPAIKLYGILVMNYTNSVDRLVVREKPFGPIKKLLIETGPARVHGWKASTSICGGDVIIEAGQEITFNC